MRLLWKPFLLLQSTVVLHLKAFRRNQKVGQMDYTLKTNIGQHLKHLLILFYFFFARYWKILLDMSSIGYKNENKKIVVKFTIVFNPSLNKFYCFWKFICVLAEIWFIANWCELNKLFLQWAIGSSFEWRKEFDRWFYCMTMLILLLERKRNKN